MSNNKKNNTQEEQSSNKGLLLGIIGSVVFIGLIVAIVIIALNSSDKKKSKDDNVGDWKNHKSTGKVLELGDYTSFTYEPYSVEVTDDDVTQYLKEAAEYYTANGEFIYKKDESRAGTEVKKDDVLEIDFTGYREGKEFEGGKGSTNLKIGSGKFIPGFEDALIGKIVGETVEIDVTFPDPYPNSPDLAGKPVVFKVVINSCGTSENYTADTLWTITEFKSNDEFRENVKKTLIENPQVTEEDYRYKCQEDYITAIIDSSSFADLSTEVDEYCDSIVGALEKSAETYGIDPEVIVTQYYGFESYDAYLADAKKNAERQVKQKYVLKEIGHKEKIVIADSAYTEYATKIVAETTDQKLDDVTKEYEETYGKGSFKDYVNQMYILDTCFEKYAKETK